MLGRKIVYSLLFFVMFGLAHTSLHIGSDFGYDSDDIVSLDCQECSLKQINILNSTEYSIRPPVAVLLVRDIVTFTFIAVMPARLSNQSRAPPTLS